MFKRYILLISGLLIMGFGIAFLTKASLGTSPISSLPLILSYITPYSFGVTTFLLSMFFIICQAILLKKWTLRLISQLVMGIIFGIAVDLSMLILRNFTPTNWIMSFSMLIIGCFLIALGIKLQLMANVVMNAGEAFVKLISEQFNKSFSLVKISFDWSLVFIALILSIMFRHSINGIGIGTIISAFGVGYTFSLIEKITSLFPMKYIRLNLKNK